MQPAVPNVIDPLEALSASRVKLNDLLITIGFS